MGEIDIVGAGADRVDDLAPLWRAMQEHHIRVGPDIPGIPPRTPEASWEVRRGRYLEWLSGEDAFVLIAEEGARAVGYALVSFHERDDTHSTGARFGELHSLAVAPDRRGGGIGTRLLHEVYRRVRAARVDEMVIAVMEGNDRVRALYERDGFVPWVTVTLGKVPDPDAPGP